MNSNDYNREKIMNLIAAVDRQSRVQKERKIMDKEHRVSVYDMVKELN